MKIVFTEDKKQAEKKKLYTQRMALIEMKIFFRDLQN